MRIKLLTRSEFTIVQEADQVKSHGQESIAQVAGLPETLAERIVSRPASGHHQVVNITWDPGNEEFIFEILEDPVA